MSDSDEPKQTFEELLKTVKALPDRAEPVDKQDTMTMFGTDDISGWSVEKGDKHLRDFIVKAGVTSKLHAFRGNTYQAAAAFAGRVTTYDDVKDNLPQYTLFKMFVDDKIRPMKEALERAGKLSKRKRRSGSKRRANDDGESDDEYDGDGEDDDLSNRGDDDYDPNGANSTHATPVKPKGKSKSKSKGGSSTKKRKIYK